MPSLSTIHLSRAPPKINGASNHLPTPSFATILKHAIKDRYAKYRHPSMTASTTAALSTSSNNTPRHQQGDTSLYPFHPGKIMYSSKYLHVSLNNNFITFFEARPQWRKPDNNSQEGPLIQRLTEACNGDFKPVLAYLSIDPLHEPLLSIVFPDNSKAATFREGLFNTTRNDMGSHDISVSIERNYDNYTYRATIYLALQEEDPTTNAIRIRRFAFIADLNSDDSFNAQNDWIAAFEQHGYCFLTSTHINDSLGEGLKHMVKVTDFEAF